MQIFWRGLEIGSLVDFRPDMWYLEGLWIPNLSSEAKVFESLTSKFDAKEVMRNAEKGTRIILKSAVSEPGTNALVICLTGNELFVRQVFEDAAVQWLIANVN